MNLPKAKEILTLLERTLAPTMAADGTDAIKLGIEAITIIEQARKGNYLSIQQPLPGETEE